jgi:hypothetical protein
MSTKKSSHGGDTVLPLPALLTSQIGTSTASHRNYHVSVCKWNYHSPACETLPFEDGPQIK